MSLLTVVFGNQMVWRNWFSANPVGCGYYPDISQLNTSCQYKLPQITSSALSENATILMGNLTFQGVGPVSRWWKSRLQYAGTYNEVWREKRYPYLPDDFDERFYNSAHPDMIYTGFLSGDENISLEGFLNLNRLLRQNCRYTTCTYIKTKE